jgi:hypothetical protein
VGAGVGAARTARAKAARARMVVFMVMAVVAESLRM